MVEVGQAAPGFRMASTEGGEVTLDELRERHRAVILAFYVLDFTPG